MAGAHDFTIKQGATWTRTLKWKDSAGTLIDTSGYTARMQIREKVSDSTTLEELTDANGKITLGIVGTGDDAYNIKLTLTSTETSAIANSSYRTFKAAYDLELSSGGIVTTILEGAVRIVPEVTR